MASRQLAMFFAKKMTKASLVVIALANRKFWIGAWDLWYDNPSTSYQEEPNDSPPQCYHELGISLA